LRCKHDTHPNTVATITAGLHPHFAATITAGPNPHFAATITAGLPPHFAATITPFRSKHSRSTTWTPVPAGELSLEKIRVIEQLVPNGPGDSRLRHHHKAPAPVPDLQ
jgi:hypothetical protein